MDKTDQYIKQCKAALEIQDIWNKKYGDYVSIEDAPMYGKVSIIIDSFIRNKEEGRKWYAGKPDFNVQCKGICTWLPRQDQLQDMLNDIFMDPTPRKLTYEFWDWIASTSPKYNKSMEQLWLAFVMHEEYNKIWNGSKWVKQ